MFGFIDVAQAETNALHTAIAVGKIDEIKKVIKNVDINEKDNVGRTALHLAVFKGNKDGVEAILAAKAKVNIQDKQGRTPMHSAAARGVVEIVQMLLDKDADVKAEDNKNQTPLHQARNADVVDLLVAAGAKVDVTDKDGDTPLHEAIYHSKEDVVAALLKNKADLNANWKNNRFPLWFATKKHNIKVIELLVQHGADVNKYDIDKVTALNMLAQDKSNFKLDTANCLISSGANIGARDNHGNTPLLNALFSNNFEFVELLINKGADLLVTNKDGYTVLHAAVEAGILKAIDLFLDRHIDVHAKTTEGKTPLHLTNTQKDQMEMIAALLAAGANVNAVDNNGETILHYAARYKNYFIAAYLVDYGAQLDLQNKKGKTPVDLVQSEIFRAYLTNSEDLKDTNMYYDAYSSISSESILRINNKTEKKMVLLIRGGVKNYDFYLPTEELEYEIQPGSYRYFGITEDNQYGVAGRLNIGSNVIGHWSIE